MEEIDVSEDRSQRKQGREQTNFFGRVGRLVVELVRWYRKTLSDMSDDCRDSTNGNIGMEKIWTKGQRILGWKDS